MARQLELVEREDFVGDVDVLDLTGYTDGFELTDRGWDQLVADVSEDEIDEALALMVQSTSEDNLASIMQELEIKKKKVALYRTGYDRYGIWLRSQLRAETGARQALLTDMRYTPPSWHTRYNDQLNNLVLGVRRTPWEDTAYTQITSTNVNSVAGTFAFNNTGGDIPARFAWVQLRCATYTNVYRHYVGFRSTRHSSTPANFQTYWSIRKAYDFGDDTTGGTSHSDATAKDGYKAVCTFSTNADMATRALVRVQDVTANYSDQRGRFRLLLRAKLSAGSTVVRMRKISGWTGSGSWNLGQRVSITGTSWKYYDMGSVSIPGHRTYLSYQDLRHYNLGVQAERVSGSGNLELDCFILIPADEGFIFSERTDDTAYVTTRHELFQFADGREMAFNMEDAAGYRPLEILRHQIYGGVPLGSGIVVMAAEQENSNDITEVIDNVGFWVYQRWASLRGTDT